MFEQIAANRRRSALLILGFVLMVFALGWLFGELGGLGYGGIVLAAIISLAMTFTSYYWSDKMVLAMSRAKPADRVSHSRLINIVEGLSIAAGIQPPKVYVVEDPAPNAFATGRNPEHAAIAVTTGLMEKMNRVELEAVIAHEMSHIRNYDILVSTIAVVLAGVIVLLSDWMLRGFWSVGGRRRNAGLPVAVLGIAVALLAPLVAQVLRMAVSRRREYLADSSGVALTRYPPGLVSALKKLQADSTVVRAGSKATAHLWIESPLERRQPGVGSWVNRLFDTHPPLEERIKLLERM